MLHKRSLLKKHELRRILVEKYTLKTEYAEFKVVTELHAFKNILDELKPGNQAMVVNSGLCFKQ